jgi:hypothetical protein
MGSVGSSAKAPPPTRHSRDLTPGCVSTVTVVEVIPLSEEELGELPSVCCESAVRQELPKMAHEHARTVNARLSRRSITITPTQSKYVPAAVYETVGGVGVLSRA